MPLPEYITAIRSIAYNTEEIRESLSDFYDDPADITDQVILEMIDEFAYEDLGGEYRLVTEDGNELSLALEDA